MDCNLVVLGSPNLSVAYQLAQQVHLSSSSCALAWLCNSLAQSVHSKPLQADPQSNMHTLDILPPVPQAPHKLHFLISYVPFCAPKRDQDSFSLTLNDQPEVQGQSLVVRHCNGASESQHIVYHKGKDIQPGVFELLQDIQVQTGNTKGLAKSCAGAVGCIHDSLCTTQAATKAILQQMHQNAKHTQSVVDCTRLWLKTVQEQSLQSTARFSKLKQRQTQPFGRLQMTLKFTVRLLSTMHKQFIAHRRV